MSNSSATKVYILSWPWHDGVNPRVYGNKDAGLRHACFVIKEYSDIGANHPKHGKVLELIENGQLEKALDLWNEIQEELAAECEAGFSGDESEGAFIAFDEHEVLSDPEKE